MAVYFFYGEEDYNIDLELEKMRSKLNPDFLSMCYQNLDGPDYQSLIQVLRTPPMMFGDSLFVINVRKYFLDKKDKESITLEDSELEDIDDALKNNPEGLDIVFVLKLPRGENKKPDSRRKLYKILSKYNPKEFSTFNTLYPKEICAWVKNCAKSKGLSIENDALELFVEQIGNNLRQFDNELEKLKLNAYPKNVVTKNMIEEICISNQDLFNITKCIMEADKSGALMELKKVLDKKHPLELLSAILTMLRQWIIVKSTSSIDEIKRKTGIFKEGRIYHLKEDLKNVSLHDLVKLKENLFDVEYRIKSGEVVDMISEVECAIIR
ncbi:DNA polymerase III subunit delta [bacterium]|nr:DNA polymerase III subunit delta [bacterium]